MKILVINAGSSSLKYQFIDMDSETTLAKGNCERIGLAEGKFSHKTYDGRTLSNEKPMKDHAEAFEQVKNALLDPKAGVIKSLDEVSAIGHRVVQGGMLFSADEAWVPKPSTRGFGKAAGTREWEIHTGPATLDE